MFSSYDLNVTNFLLSYEIDNHNDNHDGKCTWESSINLIHSLEESTAKSTSLDYL